MDAGTGKAADPFVGTVLDDRYRIDGFLGEGGNGRVYLAQHLTMRKPLAVKVIRSRDAKRDEAIARFEVEAIAAAHIEHPNAVTAIDFGKTKDGAFYLVMEYVGENSLDRVLASSDRMPPHRVTHISRQILRALRRAHALGIVHRDIKPENVALVERDGDPDFVKVMDFGLAKLSSLLPGARPVTKKGITCGTPTYMSPEQARGAHVDARSDLYSVGVLMYRMLCGRLPFEADHPVDMLAKHLRELPPRMSVVAPDACVPPALEALVLRLLAKRPEQRLQSAAAVLAALDDVSLPPAEPFGGSVIGGYEIRRRIGEGGMCFVYEALRKEDGRRVALKVFKPEWSRDETVAKRFVREAMVASSLTNPNTIQIFDFGRSERGVLYIAMELLDGESLAARLRRLSRLPPIEAAQIAVQICVSLAEAHTKGIVHRDLKPENVMLSPSQDGSARVTVLDYGLALVRETSERSPSSHSVLTQVGTILGTPSYMSPEQASGERPDARSDIYALGVILYEMLTGRAPFKGETVLHLLDQQRFEAPPPIDMDVPLSLAMLVWQMLVKSPAGRPKSAEVVRAALLEWLQTNATPARGRVTPEPAPSGGDADEPWVPPTAIGPLDPEDEPLTEVDVGTDPSRHGEEPTVAVAGKGRQQAAVPAPRRSLRGLFLLAVVVAAVAFALAFVVPRF